MRIVLLTLLLNMYFFTDKLFASLQVIQSNDKELVLLWKSNDSIQESAFVNGKYYSGIISAELNSTVNKNGVVLPAYTFFVGIPDNKPPVPDVEIQKSAHFTIAENYYTEKESDQLFQMQNGKLIDVVFVSEMNGINVAKYTLCPYTIENKKLTIVKSAYIRINFNTPTYRNISTYNNAFMSKLLLNYTTARQWRLFSRTIKKADLFSPFGNEFKCGYFKIGDGHRNGNEGTINENGLYKITGEKIIEVLGSVAMNDVALLASKKKLLDSNEPLTGSIENGLEPIPLMRFDINGNGIVDSNDYVLGYMSGVSDWTYDTINKEYKYDIHDYELYRTYWLLENKTFALTMKTQNENTEQTANMTSSFVNRKFMIQRNLSHKGCNLNDRWIWERLDFTKRTFRQSIVLENYDSLSACTVTLYGVHNNSNKKEYVFDNLKNDSGQIVISRKENAVWEILFNPLSNTDFFDVKSMELTYSSKLTVDDNCDNLTVFSSDQTNKIKYLLSIKHKTKVFIIRITDRDSLISLVDTVKNQNSYIWVDNGGEGIRYLAVSDNAIRTIPEIIPYKLYNGTFVKNELFDRSNETDYLIITHPDFINESIRLSEHKKKIGYKAPVVVTTSEIYRLFSGGNTDPSAIRNFIGYIKQYWKNGENLLYVVLMGQGNYDPKKYKFSGYNSFVPVYSYDSYVSDDFFSYCINQKSENYLRSIQDIIVGRFPVSTKEEANCMVNKIIEMEDPEKADFGPWRNRVLLVADDDFNDHEPEANTHTPQSEDVNAIINEKEISADVRKLYLYEYKKNVSFESPDASNALLDEINNGVAYVNYIGHGDTVLWASEFLLIKDKHIPAMKNKLRYPLVSSYSCSVGAFDKPDKECVSSVLVKQPDGGACATISSTVESFSPSNGQLCNAFYQSVFDTVPRSIGYALLDAKLRCNSSVHDRYVLLGDPSLILSSSVKKISITLTDSAGKSLDTIKALEKVIIKGAVLNDNNTVDLQFGTLNKNASIYFSLVNPPEVTTRKDGCNYSVPPPLYSMPGTPVAMGTVSVKNGSFEHSVIIRKNVTFNKPGVKLTAYAWMEGSAKTAHCGDDRYIFFGSNSNSEINTDSTGPEISIKPVYDKVNMNDEYMVFNDHITASLPLNIQIHLYDKNGLDISGVGPDDGLSIEIPGMLERKSLNSYFHYKNNDFKEGSAVYEITENGLREEDCSLIITAKDINGNVSLKKINLQIVNKQDLKLNEVFNYPNPFRMGEVTKFYFYPSNTSTDLFPITLYLKIYTLNGKPVRSFCNVNNGISWDGCDQDGNILSPNIYLYQVSAYNKSLQKMIKSRIKKLVIHPPR